MISDQPAEHAATKIIDAAMPGEPVAPAAPTETAEPADLAEPTEPAEPAEPSARAPRRPLPFTSTAFISATAMLLAQGVAINLASSGNGAAATVIAQLLIGLTVIPFVLAIIALVRGPHRGWAIAAMMVSVIANPLLLRLILTFFGSL